MSELKRKITFDNKEDSINLNPDSRYVLTAENINEIKEVVNNLSDELEKRLKFNHVFKFSRFNIPTTLKNNCDYNFIFELSNDINFENNVLTFNLVDNYSIFSIFENNIWTQIIENRKITKNDTNKILKVDLSSIVSDENKCYFGRFKWINITANEEYDWEGFALSVFDYNDQNLDYNFITDAYIEGRNILFEKETKVEYNVFVKDASQNIINVTDDVEFSSLFNNVTFKRGRLNVGIFNKSTFDIIIAKFTYNNINFTLFKNIIINPIVLEKIEVIKNFDKLYKNDIKSFLIKAFWSDGSSKDVTNDAIKILSLGNCKLENNNIIGDGEYDSFGKLKVIYQDIDFPDTEKIEINEYLNYEILKIKNFKTNFPESINLESNLDLTYSIKLVYSNNLEVDVTNDVDIKIINSNEIKCENGKIIINKNEFSGTKNISLLISYIDPEIKYLNYSEVKTIILTSNIFTDINLSFIDSNNNEIFDVEESSKINYKILAKYQDNIVKDVTKNSQITILNENLCEINLNNNTLLINNIEKESILMIKYSYIELNKKIEKIALLKLKPIYISKLITKGNYDGNDLTTEWNTHYSIPKTITFKGIFSNGLENDVTDKVNIILASGNTNLIKLIDKNIISFNEPTISNESVCFLATYQDEFYESKNMSVYFVINVRKY